MAYPRTGNQRPRNRGDPSWYDKSLTASTDQTESNLNAVLLLQNMTNKLTNLQDNTKLEKSERLAKHSCNLACTWQKKKKKKKRIVRAISIRLIKYQEIRLQRT